MKGRTRCIMSRSFFPQFDHHRPLIYKYIINLGNKNSVYPRKGRPLRGSWIVSALVCGVWRTRRREIQRTRDDPLFFRWLFQVRTTRPPSHYRRAPKCRSWSSHFVVHNDDSLESHILYPAAHPQPRYQTAVSRAKRLALSNTTPAK